MNRRELLRWSTFAGLAGPTFAHAAPSVRDAGGALSLPAVARLDAALDRGLEQLRARWRRAEPRPGDEALHAGLASASEALLVYQTFQELPLEAQVHPTFQRRIRSAARQVSDAARTVTAALGTEDPARVAWLDEVGSLKPAQLQQVLDRADTEAAEDGVSEHGRRRLQHLMRLATLDVREHGARAVLVDALEGSRPMFDARAEPTALTGERLYEVAEARRAWIAAGVPAADFDGAGHLEGGEKAGLLGLGIGFLVVGGALVVVGIATLDPACLCPALAFMLLGALCLVAGVLVLVVRANDLRRARDPGSE